MATEKSKTVKSLEKVDTKTKKTSISKSKKSVKKNKKLSYAINGELTVSTASTPSVISNTKEFKSPNLVVDNRGNMYTPASIDIIIDGNRKVLLLCAEQVELLLKLIGVVKFDQES